MFFFFKYPLKIHICNHKLLRRPDTLIFFMSQVKLAHFERVKQAGDKVRIPGSTKPSCSETNLLMLIFQHSLYARHCNMKTYPV